MAEFVELRLQDMLPVLEKIKQTNLLPEPELKDLIWAMKEREFKIQRPARTLEDFFAYFAVLKSLLGVLKLQREKLGYFHNVSEIEDKIRAIVTSRFGMASRNFKHDLKFWEYQLNFFKNMGWLDRVSDIFTEVTKLHGIKHPHLWVDASNFEWTRRPGKGIDLARPCIQHGIRDNPKLLLLYVQGFSLELKYVEHTLASPRLKAQTLEKENGKEILEDLILARTFFKLAKKECKLAGPTLCLEFYKAAKPFAFTKDLITHIKEDLTTEYYSNELAWDITAKIALAENNGILTQATIEQGIKAYENGLKYTPSQQMYDYYLATFDLLTKKVTNPEARLKLISQQIQVFQRAHGNLKLSEKNYVNWYHVSCNLEDSNFKLKPEPQFTSNNILELGLKKFPTNGELLADSIRDRLKTYESSHTSQKQEFKKLIKEIFKLLQLMNGSTADSTIWKGVLLYLVNSDHSTQKMLNRLIGYAPPEVQSDLKCLFVKHLSWTDMDKARSFYDVQSISPGISLQFHLDMAKLEMLSVGGSEATKDILKRVKLCFENAVRGYGRDSVEVWLSYLTFERNFGLAKHKSSSVYARALIALDQSQRENFITAELKLARMKNKRPAPFSN